MRISRSILARPEPPERPIFRRLKNLTISKDKDVKYIRVLLLTLVGGIASCTLPDLKPFADATADLQGAMITAGSNTEQVLRLVEQPDFADQLQQSWAVRLEVMTAVVRYTDSLNAIAEAGNSGSNSAGQVADAVDGLLGALSQPTLPDNYVAIAKALYGAGASVRAAGAFSKAVSKADPAIQGIASVMEKDLTDLEKFLRISLNEQERAIENKWEADNKNKGFLEYHAQLERRRRQIEKQISVDAIDKKLYAELEEVDRLLAMTEDRYAAVKADLVKVRAENIRQILVVQKTRVAIGEWAGIHAGLASDVEKGLQPNTRLLVATATDIKRLLDAERDK